MSAQEQLLGAVKALAPNPSKVGLESNSGVFIYATVETVHRIAKTVVEKLGATEHDDLDWLGKQDGTVDVEFGFVIEGEHYYIATIYESED